VCMERDTQIRFATNNCWRVSFHRLSKQRPLVAAEWAAMIERAHTNDVTTETIVTCGGEHGQQQGCARPPCTECKLCR
jgi:hypothetical protein